jgi:hypothetical protein
MPKAFYRKIIESSLSFSDEHSWKTGLNAEKQGRKQPLNGILSMIYAIENSRS